MNEFELNTYWQSLLDETKVKVPYPIWVNVIYKGLFPLAFKDNTIYLSVMENYKKNLANTDQVMDALVKTSTSILKKEVQIQILDMDEAQYFLLHGSISEDASSVGQPSQEKDISPFEPTFDPPLDPVEPEPTIPVFQPDDIYEKPVIIQQKPKAASFELPSIQHDSSLFITPTGAKEEPKQEEKSLTLDPNYTFDSFVVGNSNRIAVATAKHVAENPGANTNPLLIEGPSGLGKTHLMQAIGNEIRKTHKDFKITYLTSETFLNNFVDSIRTNQNQQFREMYRNVDVLLIDDIQFFQTKERSKTLEEFFNTFEALKVANKQIVMTSDILPVEMKDLPDRLKSRFESGAIVNVEEPDMETRLAILRNKYDAYKLKYPNIQITDEVLTYLAEKLNTNVRTLGGALNQAVMEALNQLHPLSIHQAVQIVQKLIGHQKAHHITADLIQETISSYFGIKKEDLVGTKRKKGFAYPRQIAMYLCRDLINLSYPSIASYFNKKDHTTIIHAYEKISKDIKTDKALEELIQDLKKRLQQP